MTDHELATTPTGAWPKVLAHAGYSALAPQNSLLAVDLAARSGAAGIEIDVRQTRDGEFVLWHDNQLAPRVEHDGTIAELSAAEVAELDASPPGSTYFPHALHPTPIARLTDALDLARTWDLEVHLDVKAGNAEDLVRLLDQRDLADRVLIESFDLGFLHDVDAVSSRYRLGYITMQPPPLDTVLADLPLRLASLWFPMISERPALAEQVLDRDLWFNIWTVDEPADWARCVGLGAHSVMTNDPAGCLAVAAWVESQQPTRVR